MKDYQKNNLFNHILILLFIVFSGIYLYSLFFATINADEAALADAIDKLAASTGLRARYGGAARALVVERFSAVAIGRQTVQLYNRLIS